ncbi:11854_t:CDS:2, partial [Diversispora eburnea]
GLLFSTLIQVNCNDTDTDFSSCKKKIEFDLEFNEFSNDTPSYAAMMLAVIALSGIVMRLENRYQLRINGKQPLIRFSQGWNLGGIIVVCSYHILRLIYWSRKKAEEDQLEASNMTGILQMELQEFRNQKALDVFLAWA